MANTKYDIFISYRREGGFETAKHLYDLLVRDGYRVSFDIDTLRNGAFDTELLSRIDECKDFIIILSRKSLDRCLDKSVELKNDWMRNELAYAIQSKKNIIPVFASDFVFPNNLPEDIVQISTINGIHYNKQYFDAMYGKVKDFLKSRPIHRIRYGLLILLPLIAIFLGLIIYVLFFQHNGTYSIDSPYSQNTIVIEDTLPSYRVLINARLLDTVFIKTDSVISQKIDYKEYMGISEEFEMEPYYNYFHYIDTLIDGKYAIRPYGEYVGDYYSYDSITIMDAGFIILSDDNYTNSHNPVLDVTVVNNSQETILVDELLIEVEESYTDTNPFVIIYESGGELFIRDRGWKSWKKAVLQFSLLPEGQFFDGKYQFKVPIHSSEEEIAIPMYDYFVKSGIDFEKLSTNSLLYLSDNHSILGWNGSAPDSSTAIDSLRDLLSPVELKVERVHEWERWDGEVIREIEYEDPYLVMHGELIFDNGSSFKVGGTVRFITSEGWGAPTLECSRVFDVKLKNEGRGYVIKYPVSHYLKAGEVDRIAIQIDADKTSYHTFRVRLHNVNKFDIKTDPIDLLIFKYKQYHIK